MSFLNSSKIPLTQLGFRYLPHVVINGLFYWFLLSIQETPVTGLVRYLLPVIGVVMYSGPAYFNNYYLIPKFLFSKNGFIKYTLSILSLATSLTLIYRPIISIIEDYTGEPKEPTTFWFEFAGVCVFLAAGAIIKFTADWYTNQIKLKNLQQQNTQIELELLRSQLNPHFFFNTLNTLYGLILSNSPKAPGLVLKISDLMRYSLYEANNNLTPLFKEIEFIKNYLEIQQLRTEHLYLTQVIELDQDNLEIAPHIIMPFVENVFKHGLQPTEKEPLIVSIRLKTQNGSLNFSMENNYARHSLSKASPPGGIGIASAKRKLEIVYPGAHNLKISDVAGIFRVSLDINLLNSSVQKS